MCGIAGILHQDERPVDAGLLERMTGLLAFRGPDAEGTYVSGAVGLGHRRLSVIDLETGRQPMSNEDGTIHLVSNSEIYNYRELRSELESKGHRFRTRSDTEVMVHLYEERGPRLVEKLVGMFAFALWDARGKRLLLARDRLGKKPLYYAHRGSAFVFASMPDPLFLYPEVEPDLDPVAIDLYLSLLYIPGPGTIYQGVRKLEPAHFLEWTPGQGWKKTRYWRLDYRPKSRLGIDEAVEQLGERLETAVRDRLESDVPLGAFLSGGIDSSLVAALAAGCRREPLQTFAIGNPSPLHDELPYARWMSRFLGTRHTVCALNPGDLGSLGPVMKYCPEPLADPGLVPLSLLARRARREVTVVLSGDAGDENFAGYDRYLYSRLARGFSAWLPAFRPLADRANRAGRDLGLGSPFSRRLGKFLRLLTLTPEEGHLHQFQQLSGPDRASLYAEDLVHSLPAPEPAVTYFRRLFSELPAGLDWLDRVLGADVSSYLAWDILPKVDAATMAHALECRSPFLDHRLMEFAARLPGSYKLRGLTRKHILKKYGARWLPGAILHRPKTGFGLPLSGWFLGELGETVVGLAGASESRSRTLFRPGAVQRLLAAHRSGRADCAYLLYALLVLESWLRVHPARLPAA